MEFSLWTVSTGKEDIDQRFYIEAEEKFAACLQKDPNYLPALTGMAMLMYRNMRYNDAYEYARKGLSINTYDPAANYYYGLASMQLGNITNAKDGFDISALSIEYRSAAYTELCKIYFRERNYSKALEYAEKSLDFNRYNMQAYQVMTMIYRLAKNKVKAEEGLTRFSPLIRSIILFDLKNIFLKNPMKRKQQFISLIKNELPQETFLELAMWYHQLEQDEECAIVLSLAPQTPEVLYWQAFLKRAENEGSALYEKARIASPILSFPFRVETAPILEWALKKDNDWKPKYYLGLIYWHSNNLTKAKELFQQCGMEPGYAPFYAARASLPGSNEEEKETDLQHAIQLDKEQWRYYKLLAEHEILQKKYEQALAIAEQYYHGHPRIISSVCYMQGLYC